MRVVAIDQGTTSTRALVLDTATGAADIAHIVRHATFHPQAGWVEQDAAELLANVRACLAAAGTADAVALANQGESCLAWDAVSGEPLSPVIVWQDNRTAARLGGLADAPPEIARSSGLPLDAYFSASKLAWLLDNVPAVGAAARAGRLRLGTTDAFFLDRLAGSFSTDPTTASRTSLMNLATCAWDPELCRLFGVPMAALPQIRPSAGVRGRIAGAPVLAALVDQQASLYGHGCRMPGAAKITFGTGAFALAVTGGDIIRAKGEGLLPTVAWSTASQTTYALDGGVYDAGSAVEWAIRIGVLDEVSQLDRFDAPAAIDRGLVFVPALSGLACPHWDRTAAAMWLGMSGATTRADLRQALVEGIALRTAEVVAAIDRHVQLGVLPAQAISIDGGLSRSGYFCRFLADVLGRQVVRSAFSERTAYGAALLAAAAMGAEVVPLTAPEETLAPTHAGARKREERRARFAEAVRRCREWRGIA
ncbi:FGGY family carbohydrate kinase [Ancylobacter sp. 6x-1]|uniref:ATP:glycerol 3-phosphotransferase n=1 Tax=Ancylobacter crimeensis TaxID=2579147 RepID=A0ABT0D9K0_9HYPH|nr:FGGY family carbohydrate kinase [Ancylobacter crimeensis]MCK0196625.1 FGGY family carbohydrate kinase [Ancylobacter crimeensis]